ncbi:MAG: hypothetical protein IH628_14925 [Proteobacteria bacterium]|nr:hypothetical protein [Pseudomonadota bacterium]
METKICIYCGRTLGVNELLERAGQYRCKNENDCLEYQNGEDGTSLENPDYISDLVKSSLSEGSERIDAYKRTRDERTRGNKGDGVTVSEDSSAEFAWMKSVLDVLASEYGEKHRFAFQYNDNKKNEYRISFDDADNDLHFTITIENSAGSRYALSVAKRDVAAKKDPLYEQFIYKSYPIDEKEDVIKDLSVILRAIEGEKDLISPLLDEFRTEIESRQ